MTSFDVSGLPDVPRQALRALHDALGDFVLVGMLAVDLTARGPAGLEASRLTRDVDVAVAAESVDAFISKTSSLIPGADEPSVHFHLDGTRVDVLAYGAIAPDDQLSLSDQQLDVTGLREAARTAARVRIDEELVISVASLPALVVLKLLAWADRGKATQHQDVYDVCLLLRASTSGSFADELWTDEPALSRVEYDPLRAGPFRVGRQIASDFGLDTVLRVLALLTGATGQLFYDVADSDRPGTLDQLDSLVLGLRTVEEPVVGIVR